MNRHLVLALVESWVPETKAFRIGQIEVPFPVYDVAFLTSLPAIGKHVTFDEGQGACEVEEDVKAAIDGHLTRERVRYGVALRKCYDGSMLLLNLIGIMCAVVWFYEHTDLYAHADDKYALRITIPFLEVRELERREAIVKAFSETDDFNAYEDSVLGDTQNEELELARGATETRIATSECDDNDTLRTKLHTADVASAEDVEDREPLGEHHLTFRVGTINDVTLDDGMLHKGGNDMDGATYTTEGNVVPTLECDI
ncbi:hypothetical protein Cgig2_024398 [Carnegiea gigantea]|uniref:Uncharacterized protein n=1 Tax=Carnegiea gigantea TaxID=171969 RepID=A0A9Q1GNL8_9CARY|nr:hypothetical protein Cgig2_024398 [Carnegiea gigantea]